MKILAIELDTDELPAEITVRMSRAEAELIAAHVGQVLPSTGTSSGIYDALVGGVFNRFWEDGLTDARHESGFAS